MAPANSDPTQLFAAELSHPTPVRLALAISRIAYPNLVIEEYLAQIDEMRQTVAASVAGASAGGPRALTLVQALRLELGLRGNVERYYDAANSYLNIVIERRTGLPIMLSLLLVTIGQGLGLSIEGVGFPGHFMVRYEDEEGIWFLDPFHGAVMKPEDVPAYFLKLFGHSSLNLDRGVFWPVSPTSWAMRILNNLQAVYANAGDSRMQVKVLTLMTVLEPERRELWRELGLLEYKRGESTNAARALKRYFYLKGYLVLSPPNSTVSPVPAALEESERELWRLVEALEASRTRWN